MQKKKFVNKQNPLAVELKINASLRGGEKFYSKRSEKNNETYRKKLEKFLNENKFKIKTNSSYNSLFGWFSPITEKPEAFWLD